MTIRKNLLEAAQSASTQPMVWHSGEYHTFGDALEYLDAFKRIAQKRETLVLISGKSKDAYFTILSSIIAGLTYVPVNSSWNLLRIESILFQLKAELVACAPKWAEEHSDLLESFGYKEIDAEACIGLRFYRNSSAESCTLNEYRIQHGVDDLLYVMFTSGSTGAPKGVPVPSDRVTHYVSAMREEFSPGLGEKWIQAVELNFDLSVHDMLMAWSTQGAIVSIPAEQSAMGPRFVRKLEVDNWLSVPSSAAQSATLGLLKAGSMPSLKRSFFCGEALPSGVARAWALAAPNAPLYNIYGPTEATIAFSWHRFEPLIDIGASVPIGKPLPGLKMRLSSEDEIELGGPQVFAGFLGNPSETAAKLYRDDQDVSWYRTGDRGSVHDNGGFSFEGRLDWQVKVKGNRIEIDEVEHAIRQVSDAGLISVVPVGEVAPGSYTQLCAFVDNAEGLECLKDALRTRLPEYMIPERVFFLASFPRNSNGKVDRNQLVILAAEKTRKDR